MTQTKTDKMAELIEKINELRRKEIYYHAKATQCGLAAAKLRAQEHTFISKALELEKERYKLALEYNKTKNPCPEVLHKAEKALGRKLTYEEVIEIERFYAEKAAKSNSSVAQ